jgi:hypothetical protein
VATLLLALLATKTRTVSSLVPLREDYPLPGEASLAECNTVGSNLVFLDDRSSTFELSVPDQLSAGYRCHCGRRCQKQNCQRKNRSPHDTLPQMDIFKGL